MKVGILGTPCSSGNRGVLALGSAIVNLFVQSAANAEPMFLISHRSSGVAHIRAGNEVIRVPIINWRLSPRSTLREHLVWIVIASLLYRYVPLQALRRALVRCTPWIRAVREAGLVADIWGGDSFSDGYGLRRLILGFFAAWSVILIKGSIVQLPQTYGPYRTRISQNIARYILRRSSTIIARDIQSQAVAQDLVGPGKKVIISPDVAFCLEATQPHEIKVEPPLRTGIPRGIIGLNVNGLIWNGGYTRNNMFGLRIDYAAFLTKLVSTLLVDNAGELWLIPHTYAVSGSVESDNEASERLMHRLPAEFRSRVRIVTGLYDQHELKWLIGQCDLFIGSRMHACIAALSQGVPCVGVAYSMKFAGVFETVGMQEWVVDARVYNTQEAIQRVLTLYGRRNEVRGILSAKAKEAERKLSETFENLLQPFGSLASRDGGAVAVETRLHCA